MHTAYRLDPLLKIPLSIESLASFGEHFLVGTKEGTLLMYKLRRDREENGAGAGEEPPATPRVQLLRTNKNFSRRPIVQLAAVPEYNILIVLSDGVVSVHDMDLAVTNFPTICTVAKAKNAVAFALDLVRQKTLTGETATAVRMAVAAKRKMQFYYWKNRKFLDLYPDVSLADTPRSLAWCKDSVCVGYKGEYALVKMGGAARDNLKELFPTGKNQQASVTLLNDERFALGKDEQTTFIDLEGNMKLYSVSWSEPPLSLVHDTPYLLAATSKGVEVRTDEPRLAIQSLNLPKPRVLAGGGVPGDRNAGLVYVASQTQVWCLQMVPVSQQVPQLLRDKQFELAVTLSNIAEESLDSKTQRVHQIQTLYAFDLFCNHKFKESMEVFFQLEIDASHVIGLFSDLLPQEFRNQLTYPDKPPILQGRELENGLLALVNFLTLVRHKYNGLSAKTISPYPIVEGTKSTKHKRQMMQILDTTLLKCYLRTNDALVAPLLRLKENQCHLEETERVLRRSQKFSELIIFYNTKGLHEKALRLLRDHHEKADSPLKGHLKTMSYLQNLGPEHIDLICEFSLWVLEVSEKDGLSIFTEDMIEVESLPRAKVLHFLMENKRSVVIPYLRHIILEWKEDNVVFHNALILQYKDHIVGLMDKEDGDESDGGSSSEFSLSLSDARNELMELLKTSNSYTPEHILKEFPRDCLEQERAMLLGSLGQHRNALVLYLYQLRDIGLAKDYCKKHYKPDSDVYSVLLQLMLKPPETNLLKEFSIPSNVQPPCDVDTALEVLRENGRKVDLKTALKSLPGDVPLQKIAKFLKSQMEERVSQRNHRQILRGLLHAEHLQVQEERIALESQKIKISEYDVCKVCHKRFNPQGAFVRLANGEIVHLSCKEKAFYT